MSWINRVNTKMQIRTGDGKIYSPEWIGAIKDVEYNLTEFDFPGVTGTLVKRKKARGAKYNLNIVFQGENHLDVARDFEISARDERSWTIQHPVYGQIIVQPASLNIDDTKNNVTQINAIVIETIEDDRPQTSPDAQSQLLLDRQAMNQSLSDSWGYTYQKTNESTNLLTANLKDVYDEGKKVIDDTDQFNLFVNLYNEANAAIVDNTNDEFIRVTKSIAFINSLANLEINVETRVNAYAAMLDGFPTALTLKSQKKVYENNGALVVSSMAIAAATPLAGNYFNRVQVLAMIDKLYSYFNGFLTNLDNLQSDNNGNPDSYIPDAQSMIQLSDIVNKTIGNLFQIAIGAKQERVTYLDASDNLITLTHRFIGLDPDDANIESFMKYNNIGINEILNIKKGRKILYYI